MSREHQVKVLTAATAKSYAAGNTYLEFDLLESLQKPDVFKVLTKNEPTCVKKRGIVLGQAFKINASTSVNIPELMTERLDLLGPIALSREETIKFLVRLGTSEISRVNLKRDAAYDFMKLFNEGQITDEYIEETARSMGYDEVRLENIHIEVSYYDSLKPEYINTGNKHGVRINRILINTMKSMELISFTSISSSSEIEECAERGGVLCIHSKVLNLIVGDAGISVDDERISSVLIRRNIDGLMNMLKDTMGLRTDTPAHFCDTKDERRGFRKDDVAYADELEAIFSLEKSSSIKLNIELRDSGIYFDIFKPNIEGWSASNMSEAYGAYADHCDWDDSEEKTKIVASCIDRFRLAIRILADECIKLKEYISESTGFLSSNDSASITCGKESESRRAGSSIRMSIRQDGDISSSDIMDLIGKVDGRIKVLPGSRVVPRLDKNEFTLTDDSGTREVKTLATINAANIAEFIGREIHLEGVDPLSIPPGAMSRLIENIRGRSEIRLKTRRFNSDERAQIKISFCDFSAIPDHIFEEMFSSMCGIEFVDSRPVYNSALRRVRYDGGASTILLPATDDITCVLRVPDTCVVSSKWSNNLAYIYSITRGDIMNAASIKELGANTVDPRVISDNTPPCRYFDLRLGWLLLGYDKEGIPIYSACGDRGRMSDLIKTGVENKNAKFSGETRIGRRKSTVGLSSLSLVIIGLKAEDNPTRLEYLRLAGTTSLSLKELSSIVAEGLKTL